MSKYIRSPFQLQQIVLFSITRISFKYIINLYLRVINILFECLPNCQHLHFSQKPSLLALFGENSFFFCGSCLRLGKSKLFHSQLKIKSFFWGHFPHVGNHQLNEFMLSFSFILKFSLFWAKGGLGRKFPFLAEKN